MNYAKYIVLSGVFVCSASLVHMECRNTESATDLCIKNLIMLDGAAASYALLERLTNTADISPTQLVGYLGRLPVCPLGGKGYASFNLKEGPICPNSTQHTKRYREVKLVLDKGITPCLYTVGGFSGANGEVVPNWAQTVIGGTNIDFVAKPDKGFTVGCWLTNGIMVQTGGVAYTLSNVSACVGVEVRFKKIP